VGWDEHGSAPLDPLARALLFEWEAPATNCSPSTGTPMNPLPSGWVRPVYSITRGTPGRTDGRARQPIHLEDGLFRFSPVALARSLQSLELSPLFITFCNDTTSMPLRFYADARSFPHEGRGRCLEPDSSLGSTGVKVRPEMARFVPMPQTLRLLEAGEIVWCFFHVAT
jgi:hypothetical protein